MDVLVQAMPRHRDHGHERPAAGSKLDTTAKGETCVICLEQITQRAVAFPCNHLSFDFLCLSSWLGKQPNCPLCKAIVSKVEYNWKNPLEFDTFRVPQQHQQSNENPAEEDTRDLSYTAIVQRTRRRDRAHLSLYIDHSLDKREWVYNEKLFSFRVGANSISGYRDFTREQFANSQGMQIRARTFLRRELRACIPRTLRYDQGQRLNPDFVLEYIVAILGLHDIKSADGEAETMLAEYLGSDIAKLLLHELEAWLRSPYTRLNDWDQRVQYTRSDIWRIQKRHDDR